MFGDDKKKNDKDSYYDNLKDLHYKDSWLHNTVELAALGAIMVGAGKLAVDGDYSEVSKGLKQATKVMAKGGENYFKRSGSVGAKFGYQALKRTFGNLSRMTPPIDDLENLVPGSPAYHAVIKNIESTPGSQKRISAEVAKRLNDEADTNLAEHKIYGAKLYPSTDNRYQEIYQQVKDEEIKKALGYSPTESAPKKKGKWFGTNPDDTNPMINPKNIGRDMVTNGLAGLAFAGGLSGFHALDRWSGNKDSQKNLENSFSLAGSFLSKDEDNKMKKQAALHPTIKDGLKAVGMKFPEAVMGGLGYTAVSYGANKALGHDPRQGGAVPPSAQNLDSDKNNEHSPHVIIELRSPGQHKHQKKQEATLKVASFNSGLAGLASRKGNESNGSTKSVR